MNIQTTLREVFGSNDPKLQAALQDLFALGCYLCAKGDESAGLKSCATALRAAGCGKENKILAYVENNSHECFEAAWPHNELKSLMKELPSSST